MTEDWDFYMCEIEGQVASIFLDLSLIETEHTQPQLISVNVTMQTPREDGLSSKDEAESLYTLEDILVSSFETIGCKYVGRLTFQGHRIFYAYGPQDAALDTISAALLASTHETEVSKEEDAQWAYYHEWLYPSSEEMQDIQNRRVVMKLSEYGDQLDTPRQVDHTVLFEDESHAQSFAAALEPMGFSSQTDQTEDGLAVQFHRDDPVEIHHINALVRTLHQLALDHQGFYDGWGCPIVA